MKAEPDRPPIGRMEFRVDAFVPDRMAVELGNASGAIIPGKPYALPVTARFLYGAPAAGLTGQAQMRLVIDPAPFPSLAGYRIGLIDETYAPDSKDLPVPDTDAQGHSSVSIDIQRAPDTTHALKASLTVGVNDPSGHASLATTEIPLRPAGKLLGIKPAFADSAIDAGTEAAFDIVAVGPDGVRAAAKAKLRLVRERPDWRLVMRGSLARYETVWRDEPLETQVIDIPDDAPFHFAHKLDFGRYRIEVLEDGGMAASSMRFRAGWVSSDNPDVPDQVDVSADRKSYAPGDTARIHIAPPFAGEATLLVLSDRVHSVRNLSVSAGGTDVDVPVSADWGPGAYVTVHVFRPAADAKSRPGRAIGLAWVGHRSERAQAAGGVRRGGQVPAARPRRDQVAHRARRLGHPRCGGRRHPAADKLRLARSVRPFPRPPPARARYPRRLGPADRATRRRGDRAAPRR